MTVMSESWMIFAIIVLGIALIVLTVYLWTRYRKERQRNRRPPIVPMPKDNRKSDQQAEKEDFFRTAHSDAGEVIYANVPSTVKTVDENIYENLPPVYNEKISNHPNVSSDMNPLLSQSQNEVSVIKPYSTEESVNKINVLSSSDALGPTSQQNNSMGDSIVHIPQYDLKDLNTSSSSVHIIPNLSSPNLVSSKSNLGEETSYTPKAMGGKSVPRNLQNKSTENVSRHNNILTISWDFQKDKNIGRVDPECLPGATSWRSRTNSLPSKVVLDKSKLPSSLHHKITLELSSGSNPDVLYDIPRRIGLSSDHKRLFKSANNASVGNQFDERSSKCVVYENVIIRTDW